MNESLYILGVVVVVKQELSLKNELLIRLSETCKKSVSSEKKNRFYDFSVEKMSRLFWENCLEILSGGRTVEFQKIKSENQKKKFQKIKSFST